MRKEQLIFHDNSSVFGQIEKSLNCFKDIYIKFKKTESPEISWLPRVWIHSSFRT